MNKKLKAIAASIAATIAVVVMLTGCKTTNSSGVKVFDPVKTEQVKAAVEPFVASIARRILLNNPKQAAEIGNYMRAVGGVFCDASSSGQLSPDQIITAIDGATANLQNGADPLVIDGKNLIITIYRIAYGERFKAELPADQWPKNVADVLCAAIDQGLKDAGQAGVK